MAYFADTDNAPSKFLSGVGFQLTLNKLPGVSYYCQSVTVPSLNLAVAEQPTMYRRLPEPGDEVNYDDLSIRFLVDEDMKNYISIHNWLRYLGYPESDKDWTTFADGETYEEKQYSDGALFILDSNFKKKFEIYFKDLFPVSLGGLNLDATYTDTEYFAIDATFKYSIFDIKEVGATTFFKQSSLVAPTVTLNSGVSTVDGEDVLTLTYTSTNAETLVIGNGVGSVSVTGSGVTLKVADIRHLSYNGTISYTITATSADNLTAEATTTATLPGVTQTSANRTCIAILDENVGSQTYLSMAAKWKTFRDTYPDRIFWLLQPNASGEGSNNAMYSASKISDLHIPPQFLEETDPTKVDL